MTKINRRLSKVGLSLCSAFGGSGERCPRELNSDE